MDYMHILHEDNNNGCPHSPLRVPPPLYVNGNVAYTTKLTFCIYLFLLYIFIRFFSLSSLLPAARHNKMRRKIA